MWNLMSQERFDLTGMWIPKSGMKKFWNGQVIFG